MKHSHSAFTIVMLLASAGASADVTVQEQLNLDVASIKAHGTTTRRFTSDKQRTETEFRCDGLLSMLCGKNNGLEIVRLDRGVTLSGEPAKQRYTETPLPTPEQTRALEERMRATMEKLKSCPAPAHSDVDTSKCQMSPPVINVTKADDVVSIAGHDTHHTIVSMTQSCANKDSGDSCDMAYTYDLWLASEELPALAERRAFDRNYIHRLGLDEAAGAAPPAQLSQFLAPYRDALRKLGSESGGLQGYPLKSAFRVAIGGPHCAAASGAGKSAGAGEAHADAGTVGGMIGGSAGAMAGKLLGGLFGKKKPAEATAAQPTGGAGAAAATPAAPAMTTIAEFTVTTTAIGTEAIPPDQFEMPADWKKIPPREQSAPEEPSCPKSGG